MNDPTIEVAAYLAVVAVCSAGLLFAAWAMTWRGRKRWSTERADRVVAESIQIIKAGPGDAVVVTYAGMLIKEQRGQIVEAIERRLPKGVKAMLLDGGLRMSHVVSVKDAPVEQFNEARNG